MRVGRWAAEREAIESTCLGEANDLDDPLGPMSADRRDQLVDALLARLAGPPRGEAPSGTSLRDGISCAQHEDETELDMLPAELRAAPSVAANGGCPWGRIASHLGVAATAAAITVLVHPLASPAPPDRHRVARLRAASDPAGEPRVDAPLCLDEGVHVRLVDDDPGQSPSRGDQELEIVLEAARPGTGSTHWVLHHPAAHGWWHEDDGTLSFDGTLRTLAPLEPGAWTLTFQVGLRGRCGPHATAGCQVLEPIPVVVAQGC
ncbi:MAG: hypothetical protein KDK70_13520 [Myxococcales bacterium]|nr:hypothetical protein [Myxococcales bacterium]